MSRESFLRHIRKNRSTDRLVFTLMCLILTIGGVDSWREGDVFWVWVYALFGVVYVPLTLLAWFLPDEDLD